MAKPGEDFSKDLFLGIDKVSYLTGNYDPIKVLARVSESEFSKDHFLRHRANKALMEMIDDFEKSKPTEFKQHLFLVSSFRSFSHQKGIWENKFLGKKEMRLPVKGKSESEIISLILEFSSAPGTSRHHWGTDFDLNFLENSYFENQGRGSHIYQWLNENAEKFGFCQPYNKLSERGGKGYQEEKWHWSFAPEAMPLQRSWEESFKNKSIRLSGKFLGSQAMEERALEYVTSINPKCAKVEESFQKKE